MRSSFFFVPTPGPSPPRSSHQLSLQPSSPALALRSSLPRISHQLSLQPFLPSSGAPPICAVRPVRFVRQDSATRPTIWRFRSRRGAAPEGSSLFSPGVGGAQPRRPRGNDGLLFPTTPLGCRTHQSGNQCDTLSGSWGFLPAELSRGLRRGLRPSSTPGLKTVHPFRGAMPPTDPVCRYH